MIKNKKVLVLIPARGGSKGIPGKNIKDLCGKPLIAHTICAARECEFVDTIVVSTDSEEIAEVSKRYGAEVPFLRPEELASDTAKTMDAVLHAVKTLKDMGKAYDILVLLQPTSPLRNGEDIRGAISLAVETGEDVVGISEVSDSPILMRTCDSFHRLTRLLEQNSTVRRQDMPIYYRVNGSVYVNHMDRLTEETSFNDNPLGYVVPKERSVDIDEPVDFVVAEYYMGRKP